ncbi:hypothetical protein RHSIM_Rhsim10G0130700 [Rhododendron simsii]|uniref:Uncharacterized protein n=1 Tax=Rhododendron simsii TaxID=118357 RepID=A0A834GCN8_RHOSS|nr:hypothetical protein RHSIM_Rhsim10G0130700 [Rhododendron simsii]
MCSCSGKNYSLGVHISFLCMNAFSDSDGSTAFEAPSPNRRRGLAAKKGESAQVVFQSPPPELMKTSVSRCFLFMSIFTNGLEVLFVEAK